MTRESIEMTDTAKNPDEFDCPDCESPMTYEWRELHFEYGQGKDAADLTVNVPMHCCVHCDLQFLGEKGSRLKHEAVCSHLGLLSPSEIRTIRVSRNLNREEFARLTGLGEATLGRWERGSGFQSQANDRYLRLLREPGALKQLTEVLNKAARVKENALDAEKKRQRARFPRLHLDNALTQAQKSFELFREAA